MHNIQNIDYLLISNTSWNFIFKNPKYEWDSNILCNRSDFSFELVKSNPNFPWDWDILSESIKLKLEFVCDNSNFPWNWTTISSKYNLYSNMLEYIAKVSIKNHRCHGILKQIEHGSYTDDKLFNYFN